MIHNRVAKDLKPSQRDLLIEHVDGATDVPVPVYVSERTSARNNLISKKLIRPDRAVRATKTIITEDGRQVLAYVLADYADALVRAGYTGLSSPMNARPRPIAIVDSIVPEIGTTEPELIPG